MATEELDWETAELTNETNEVIVCTVKKSNRVLIGIGVHGVALIADDAIELAASLVRAAEEVRCASQH